MKICVVPQRERSKTRGKGIRAAMSDKRIFADQELEEMGTRTLDLVSEPIYQGACQFVFYRNPADVPEEFYARIGKKIIAMNPSPAESIPNTGTHRAPGMNPQDGIKPSVFRDDFLTRE
jgi:hypothetical protein